jgi:hypothetical protein
MKDGWKSMRNPMNIVLGAICGIVIGYSVKSANDLDSVATKEHIEATILNQDMDTNVIDVEFYPYWKEADFKAKRGSMHWKEIAHYGIGLPE